MLLEEAGINMSNSKSPHGYIDLLLVTNSISGQGAVGILTHGSNQVMVYSGSYAKTESTFGKAASGKLLRAFNHIFIRGLNI